MFKERFAQTCRMKNEGTNNKMESDIDCVKILNPQSHHYHHWLCNVAICTHTQLGG
jgi:hypothetical protein